MIRLQQWFEVFLGEVLRILITTMLHNFRLGARHGAKGKNPVMRGIIWGIIWGVIGVTGAFSCGLTFSTATGASGTTMRNTSPSINSGVPPEYPIDQMAVLNAIVRALDLDELAVDLL